MLNRPASKEQKPPTHADRDRVVFVHDRHDTHTQELPDGIHCIQVSRPLSETRFSREKDPYGYRRRAYL